MFIKRPGGLRKHYALVGADGKTLHDERIDKLNADLDAGFPIDSLEVRMRAIRDSFKGLKAIDGENLKIANALQTYKVRRKGAKLSRPETSHRRLLRAAKALGAVKLHTAREEEIWAALDGVKLKSRYHVIGAINELLRYCKRDFTLFNPQPDRPDEITFITIPDFEAKIVPAPPPIATYLGALFATGCRLGELPRAQCTAQRAYVSTQLRRNGDVAPTKNRKSRVAPVLPPLSKYIDGLNALGRDAVSEVRLEQEKELREAAQSLLGINVHDLRHSYCVAWAEKGASPHELADYIGDTVAVAVRHYRNYCLTDEQVERALEKWNAVKPKKAS